MESVRLKGNGRHDDRPHPTIHVPAAHSTSTDPGRAVVALQFGGAYHHVDRDGAESLHRLLDDVLNAT